MLLTVTHTFAADTTLHFSAIVADHRFTHIHTWLAYGCTAKFTP